MRRSPNQKYQLWSNMFVMGAILFLITTYITITITWDLLNSEQWGAFNRHASYALKHWSNYWNALSKDNLRTQFYMHLALPIIFSVTISVILIKKMLWVDGGRDGFVHVNGPQLYQSDAAIRNAEAMNALDLKNDKRAKNGIKVHPGITVSTSREQTNFLILGTTGSGKSMIIKYMIEQIIQRGDFAFIFDEKKEYTSKFYNKETTILVAPWDARGVQWDICSDIENEQDAKLIATSLIPTTESEDQMWIKGAQLIFAGMIITLMSTKKTWGWSDLADMLKKPQDQMLALFSTYFPIATTFIIANSKTTQGFYVNLITSLSWLDDMAIAWPDKSKEQFSIKKWVCNENTKKIIIVQADPCLEELGTPLCNALISLMTRYFLSQKDGLDKKTWLIVDEAANLPPNPYLKKWLELSRSRGGRCVIGTQSISQLKQVYGENNTDTILNLLSTVISLRMGSAGDDAKYTAKIFGERDVEYATDHENNLTWHSERRQIVEGFQLTQLKMASKDGVDGFILMPGWNAVYKLKWPLYIRQNKAQEHSPADWLLKPSRITKKISANRLNNRVHHAND